MVSCFAKHFTSLSHFTPHQPDEEAGRDHSTDFIGGETKAHGGIEKMRREPTSLSQ